ncbi:MAG: RagB/SusD family nutrient uptake outer membrane protein [Longimicrobiales bacterium]
MRWISNAMRRCAGAVATLGILGTAACSDFLQVEDPGRYTDDALNTPLALNAVVNGVEGDLWGAFDDLSAFHGLMSDEFQHTGTWAQWEDMDRGRQFPAVGTDNGVHSSLLQRRTAAKNAETRLTTVMGDTAGRSILMARAVAMQGWIELLLGMHACESPKEANGAIISDIDIYKLAIPLLTKAADIARTAGSTAYERMAVGGRARAKLFTGDLAGALADAQTIPDDFVYSAKYSETGTSNTISTLAYYARLKAGGLDPIHQAKVDTVANLMRDPFSNQHDPRLAFTRRGNGADNVKKHYNQEKYKSPADDIIMVSGWEMRLIEAEVYMKQGNLAQAVAQINKVRTHGGLTAHSATGATAATVQEWLLWERFSQLYLEGHRMNDLARFNLVRTRLGAGRSLKFPLSRTEILNNSAMKEGEATCPKIS